MGNTGSAVSDDEATLKIEDPLTGKIREETHPKSHIIYRALRKDEDVVQDKDVRSRLNAAPPN